MILTYFRKDHVILKSLVTGLSIGKTLTVKVVAQTKHECDLNWCIYLIIVLILEISFWLILYKIKEMKQWQRNLFPVTVHMYMFLADTKHHVPIKPMAMKDNPREFREEVFSKTRCPLTDIYFETH